MEIYQVLSLLILFGGFILALLTYITNSIGISVNSSLNQRYYDAIYGNGKKKDTYIINLIFFNQNHCSKN